MTGLTARAPAKLNLQLSVGPLRPDGYHDVATVYHAVSLFDEVTVRSARRVTVRVTGEGAAQVPLGRGNLAARAAQALRRACGIRDGVTISIRKRIPVAAGLAGGSADAAATLVACNSLWQTGMSQADLADLGAGVGCDVPAVLTGGTAVGLGRGEQLSPALVSGRYHWVLAIADTGLSTAAVYAEFDRMRGAAAAGDGIGHGAGTGIGGRVRRGRPRGVRSELLAALRSGDAAAVGGLLSNDLEAPALSLRPQLGRALEAGREHGAIGAMVSGSGPTCAFLAREREHALDLAAGLTGAGLFRHVTTVVGPVPGAVIMPQAAGQPTAT